MAFEDLGFWFEIIKWLVLFFVGWWWYNWVREKLAFSPLLTLVVAALVVYYLVIEHPVIGSIGVFGWILMTSGILFMLPTFSLVWNTLFPRPLPKRPEMAAQQRGYG